MPLFHSDRLDKQILAELRDLRNRVINDYATLAANDCLIFDRLGKILDLLQPRLTSLVIQFHGGIMPASIEIGKTTTASVQGLDQFGNPFTIDLVANPPSWSIADPSIATASPNPTTPTSEDIMGVAAGSTSLGVSCAGLSTTDTITVTAPVPVLTSLRINFS